MKTFSHHLLFAFMVLCGCDTNNWSSSAVTSSKVIGEEIVAEIFDFKSATGAYPAKISDLNENYPTSLPRPLAGTGVWKYRTLKNGKDFVLEFSTDESYPTCYYQGSVGYWIEDR